MKKTCVFYVTAYIVLLYHTVQAKVLVSTYNQTISNCDNHKPLSIENGWLEYGDKSDETQATIYIRCKEGYILEGPSQKFCSIYGIWKPAEVSKCIKPVASNILNVRCESSIKISNGEFMDRGVRYPGDSTYIKCYNKKKLIVFCDKNGRWRYRDTDTLVTSEACPKNCIPPPSVPHAKIRYNYFRKDYINKDFSDGEQVTYQCDPGYTLFTESNKLITAAVVGCHNGNWDMLPSCLLNRYCDSPKTIENGHHSMEHSTGEVFHQYSLGVVVTYGCNQGFKLVGEGVIKCLEQDDRQYWSHAPPQCIPTADESIYCDDPAFPIYGKCVCHDHDVSYCQPFLPGMKVTCTCKLGYISRGDNTRTCLADGSWMGEQLQCEIDGNSDKTSSTFHVSTLAIIVATACSILGLLLFVMVIVVFRRHKPRSHLYPGSPAPPPYTRVHNNSISDHDRMALISCDSRRFPLPSYEEAVANPHSAQRPSSGTTDFHPLPPVPVTLRSALISGRHVPPNPRTPSIPEVYGSRDTVNVSMSDASTSITVETYDSGASNPSMTSRRVHTGSLHSASTCSIVTEDAPLLEGSYTDGRTSQEPIEDVKDENQ